MRKADLEAIGFEYENTYHEDQGGMEVKCEEYIKNGENKEYQLRATFQDNILYGIEFICPQDIPIQCDQLKTLKTLIQLLEAA